MNALSRPPDLPRGQQTKSSRWWAEHLRRDLQRDWTIPWHHDPRLSEGTRDRIAASIAEFQRGESSAARNYLAKSAHFSRKVGDPMFHRASELFVAAENAHADLLLRFMQKVGIPTRPSTACDGVFRWLRGRSDLGWSSRVLLVAELIAQEYYPCLRIATEHPALVRICDQIIAEEAGHIRFQLERIARVEASHRGAVTRLRDRFQAALMVGTAGIVYRGHRAVLSTQLTLRTFVARVHERNRRAITSLRALRGANHRHAASSVSRCDSIWRTTIP